MNILGITAEYNPFHNGHKYHIKKSEELISSDYTVCVMSGDFTQRGEPALLDKWERAKLAAENGIDLVIELPFVFACNQADVFARGAVDILAGLGVTHISFGSECGDIAKLELFAEKLCFYEGRIAGLRTEFMKNGSSFAAANERAVSECIGSEYSSLMKSPNNILAIEYLKRIHSLEECGRHIEAVTFERAGSGYFGKNEEEGFAGASAIREMIGTDDSRLTEPFVPQNVFCKICENTSARQIEYVKERFFLLIKGELIRKTADELAAIYRVGEGIENKLKKEILKASSLDDFVERIVSRRYTEATVRRILVYILLGIAKKSRINGLYARILAVGNNGRELLRLMKKEKMATIPLVNNLNKDIIKLTDNNRMCIEIDAMAADMYNVICGRQIYEFSDRVRRPFVSD